MWGSFGQLMRPAKFLANFASPERVLSHPRGEIQTISPHPQLPTDNQQTTCSERAGRNRANFAPREKKKKFAGAKIKEPNVELLERGASDASSQIATHAQKPYQRILRIFPVPRLADDRRRMVASVGCRMVRCIARTVFAGRKVCHSCNLHSRHRRIYVSSVHSSPTTLPKLIDKPRRSALPGSCRTFPPRVPTRVNS